MTPIQITGPVTVTLSPNTFALILDALAEKPFKVADAAFRELVDQLKPKEPSSEQPASGSQPPSVGNGSDNGHRSVGGSGVRRHSARGKV